MPRGRERLDDLDEGFKAKATVFLEELEKEGIDVCVTSGRRTINQQNVLYAQGRSSKGSVVTYARGGCSPHNFGMAIDVCPVKDGDLDWNSPHWNKIGEVARRCGLTWGGDFKTIKDRPHVEEPKWKKAQLAWRRGELNVA